MKIAQNFTTVIPSLILSLCLCLPSHSFANNAILEQDTSNTIHQCPHKKMVKHIVLLSFKPNLSEKQIQHVFNELKNLALAIPEIKSFSAGKYDSNENLNRGYTHAFIMHFDNTKARDLYLDHPKHKRVAKQIVLPALKNGLHSVLAFDYQS